MRILYVEDNDINALVLSKFFKGEDFHIAKSGEEALRIVQEQSPFDFFFIDINLGRGVMDGVELFEHLRSMEATKHIPAFAITAYALPLDAEKYLDLGFDEYFPKPIEIDQLKSALTKYYS